MFAIQTINDSSLWWAHGWKDRHIMLYDVINNNDVTSALSSRVWKKYAFYWCIDFEKLFSLTYRLAKLFERPSYRIVNYAMHSSSSFCWHLLHLPSCWRSIVVRTSILAGELSLSCARLMDGCLTALWVKASAISQPTRPIQPAIPPESIK